MAMLLPSSIRSLPKFRVIKAARRGVTSHRRLTCIDSGRELQDVASAFLSRTWNEEQALRKYALNFDLKRLRNSIAASASQIDPKLADKLDEDLFRARILIYDGEASLLLSSKADRRYDKSQVGRRRQQSN